MCFAIIYYIWISESVLADDWLDIFRSHPDYKVVSAGFDDIGDNCFDSTWMVGLALNCTVTKLQEIGGQIRSVSYWKNINAQHVWRSIKEWLTFRMVLLCSNIWSKVCHVIIWLLMDLTCCEILQDVTGLWYCGMANHFWLLK